MKSILSWCYKNITKRFPGTVLLIALILSGFSIYLAFDLKFNPKIDNLLPQDLPLIKDFNQVVSKTGGSGPLVVVLENLDPIRSSEAIDYARGQFGGFPAFFEEEEPFNPIKLRNLAKDYQIF